MTGATLPPDQSMILDDLRHVGYDVASLEKLRESGVRYKAAIPVLLEWLPRVTDKRLKEEIVRALSVPWAKSLATLPMIEEFKKIDLQSDPKDRFLGWAMGNALEVLADDSAFDALVELARQKRYGTTRQMIVLALGKSKRPEAVEVLLGLADDPDVDGHAVSALARLRAPAARPVFEAKLNDHRAWVRKAAKKGLARNSHSAGP